MTAYKGPHLVVAVEVDDNKLHLRQALAEAKVENGDTIEVATSFSGHVLVTVYHKKKNKGWRTYTLSPSALVEAVLAAEQKLT